MNEEQIYELVNKVLAECSTPFDSKETAVRMAIKETLKSFWQPIETACDNRPIIVIYEDGYILQILERDYGIPELFGKMPTHWASVPKAEVK